MLTRHDREQGFTLVELLVVIIIIGILAAIAIPVFLNQRQRANDAAVESAIKSYINATESYLVSNPNAEHLGASTVTRQAIVDEGARKTDGVVVQIYGGSSVPGGYVYCGYHPNGKKYTSLSSGAFFQSNRPTNTRIIVANCATYSAMWRDLP